MASMDDGFDATAGMDMHTSPLWDTTGADMAMFDTAADTTDSFFDASQYLNIDGFGDSPAAPLGQFGESSADFKISSGVSPAPPSQSMLHPRSAASSSSPDSSSHDSSSDSSSGNKKRKTSSESSPTAISDAVYMRSGQTWQKKEPRKGDTHKYRDSVMAGTTTSTLADQEIESINKSMAGPFPNFGSTASSPGFFGNSMHDQASPNQISQNSTMMDSVPSITTVRPAATFSFGSREQSPSSAAVTHSNEGSPAALFNFSPEAPEALFQSQSMWNGSSQNQTWQNTMSMGAVEVSPSPTAHSSLMQFPSHPSSHRPQKSTLHIDPISDKSRVETQINVRLTLVSTPLNVTKLHLPRHTISKPKLLAKEEEVIKAPDTLELHTMLVCTSAMEKPELLDRALKRAAGIESVVPKKEPRRASTGDADDDADDPEKPCNGGEVRICENCMQRERKRASRKRVKKGEDETEWYKYEQQRVIVFNTNEYKEWQQPTPSKDTPNEAIQWPARTMQISAPMRIACYCRHQNEKSGFRVIFTIKDFMGNLVAQQITTSISITDDHKTKDPQNPASRVLQVPEFPTQPNFFPTVPATTQSDMHSTLLQRSHYSTNDLQAMQQHYQPSSMFTANGLPNVAGNIVSQPASTAITPHNRSRQASPTVQQGPNKKRKNSSIHRLPQSLTMTRADAPQPLTMPNVTAAGIPSASTAAGPSPFSPTSRTFLGASEMAYGMPAGPVAPMMNTGPPTPNSNSGLITPGHRSASLENLPYHYYSSLPNSAHPSRAPSPIASTRIPMNVMNQPTAISSAAMHMNAVTATPYATEPQPRRGRPIIRKILPPEGPVAGGIEVTVLGMNFQRDMEVMFGDNVATTTTYWADNTLVCLLPPAQQSGLVSVTFTHEYQTGFTPSSSPSFKYIDNDREQLFELAFRVVCQKNGAGSNQDFVKYAQQLLGEQHSVWGAAPSAQGHSSMHHRQASGLGNTLGHMETEDTLLKFLDIIDLDDSPEAPQFDLVSRTGATMLSLAATLGYDRFAAGLLARGANPNLRDVGGFTPLMKAVMRNRPQLVRRLITKGADPFVRNVRGQQAIDYVTSPEIFTFLRQAQRNKRPRSIAGTPHRSRANSMVSMRSFWEPPSPSQTSITGYDGEVEQSDESEFSDSPDVWTVSRRSSANWDASRRGSRVLLAKDLRPLTAPAASPPPMSAWRDQLAAQIQHFQQAYQWNLPNGFQFPGLPPMPQIPDYQAYPLMRRISSLLPQPSLLRAEPPPETQVSPPSYDEIYPEKIGVQPDSKEKLATIQAVAEAALDQVAEQTFDLMQGESSSSTASLKGKGKLTLRLGKKAITKEQQDLLRRTHAEKMKKLGSDRRLFFIWIPVLFLVLALMLRSQIPAFSSWSPFAIPSEQPVAVRIEAL